MCRFDRLSERKRLVPAHITSGFATVILVHSYGSGVAMA